MILPNKKRKTFFYFIGIYVICNMIETKVKIRYIFALTLTVLFTHQSTWGASADIDTTLTQKSAAAGVWK